MSHYSSTDLKNDDRIIFNFRCREEKRASTMKDQIHIGTSI